MMFFLGMLAGVALSLIGAVAYLAGEAGDLGSSQDAMDPQTERRIG